MRTTQLSNCVSSYPSITMDELLSGTDAKTHESVTNKFDRISLRPESVVCQMGEAVDDVFVLRDGCVTAAAGRDRPGGAAVPSMPGQVFGLVEMLSGTGYQMDLRTITPTDLDVIASKRFLGLMTENPRFCLNVATAIARLYHDAVSSIQDH